MSSAHAFEHLFANELSQRVYTADDVTVARCEPHSTDMAKAYARLFAAAPELLETLIAAKQEMWMQARHHWTMADFKNWAIIQQIDAALEKADGKARTETAIAKALGEQA